jgi:hypothetical protein
LDATEAVSKDKAAPALPVLVVFPGSLPKACPGSVEGLLAHQYAAGIRNGRDRTKLAGEEIGHKHTHAIVRIARLLLIAVWKIQKVKWSTGMRM